MTETAGTEPGAVLDDAGLPPDRPRTVGRRIVSGLFSYGLVALAVWYLITNLQTGEWTSAMAWSRP